MTPLPRDRNKRSGFGCRILRRVRRGLLCAGLVFVLFVLGPSRAQETGFAALAERLVASGDTWGRTIDLKDPCPAPQTDSMPPADDLSTLQADIDRFTLCAERADMLRRLNEATLGKDGAGGEKADTTLENPGFRLRSAPKSLSRKTTVPPVSEDELEAPPGEGGTSPASADEWSVVTIFGSGAGLQVRLRKGDGSVAQARAGTILPDGWTVGQVSTGGVVLTKDGRQKTLAWME